MSFTNKIITGIKVPSLVSGILKKLSVQRSFLQKNIQPILLDTEKQNDGSLDAADFKKINEYYGLAVPAILGEAFCLLHGKEMSDDERMASTSQGAMTGLFDDFFDKQYLSDDTIEDLVNNKIIPGKRSNEKLFDVFYKNALQLVPDKKKLQDALMEVYKAQLESKKQTQETISEKEIQSITFYKGGTSLLFYRTAFLPVPSTGEEKLIYDLGSLMQLCNDIFDVYKDRENKIKTLVTEVKHIAEVRELLQELLSTYYLTAYDIGFPKKNMRQFLSILSLGIFSRAFVCLDQLEKNEATTNNVFNVQQYSRKQLICDMDVAKNKLRSAWYHVKLVGASA
ncbi:MAG: hypothetical protein QM737_14560 [Ferruginibacter sp.]